MSVNRDSFSAGNRTRLPVRSNRSNDRSGSSATRRQRWRDRESERERSFSARHVRGEKEGGGGGGERNAGEKGKSPGARDTLTTAQVLIAVAASQGSRFWLRRRSELNVRANNPGTDTSPRSYLTGKTLNTSFLFFSFDRPGQESREKFLAPDHQGEYEESVSYKEGRSSSRKLGKKLGKLRRFLIIIARLLDFFFFLVLLFLEFGFNRGSSHHRRVDRDNYIWNI